MIDIEKNYQALQHRIQSSLVLTGQEKSGFTVVAVSKKKSLADIESAYNLGLNNFGENFVQEAIKKIKSEQKNLEKQNTQHRRKFKIFSVGRSKN